MSVLLMPIAGRELQPERQQTDRLDPRLQGASWRSVYMRWHAMCQAEPASVPASGMSHAQTNMLQHPHSVVPSKTERRGAPGSHNDQMSRLRSRATAAVLL